MNEENVKDAVLNHDKSQKLNFDDLELLFYSKSQPETSSYLVICGQQRQDEYSVDYALSILPARVGNILSDEPLSLLQQLALTFGLPVRIGIQINRFILNQTIPMSDETRTKMLEVLDTHGHSFFMLHYFKLDTDSNTVHCALVLCIDTQEHFLEGAEGIFIAPQLRSTVTPLNFMDTGATLTFHIPAEELHKGMNGFLFKVIFRDYYFELGFSNNEVYLIRNHNKVSLLVQEPNIGSEGSVFYVSWSPTELILVTLARGTGSDPDPRVRNKSSTVQTPPTLPTNGILQWARRLNMLRVLKYATPKDFYQSVLFSIQSIQEKVNTSDMYNAFWNIQYSSGRIVSRKPKRETDIVATLHGLLIDIARLKNFQIYPETPSSSGKLDFLITSVLSSLESISACIEFKHAHSPDLSNGLMKQLPEYMGAYGSQYGIYCALYFKGPYFDHPEENISGMEYRLKKMAADSGLRDINFIILNLSQPVPASQL